MEWSFSFSTPLGFDRKAAIGLAIEQGNRLRMRREPSRSGPESEPVGVLDF